MEKPEYKCRLFCFTDFDVEPWTDPVTIPICPRWCVWQIEGCPNTGREHVQGACYWKDPTTLKECIRRIFGDRGAITGHVEAARGGIEDQVRYCTKEDTRVAGPWEVGERPAQGKRTDLGEAMRLYRQRRWCELDEQYGGTAVRYLKHLEAYDAFMRNQAGGEDLRIVECHVIYGGAGLGKSSRMPRGPNVYWGATRRSDGTFWWNGYKGQGVIVLDDFKSCDMQYFMRLLDRYPFQVETKGGFEWARWESVYITSNTSPERWWPNASPDEYNALMRRLTSVTEVRGNTEPSLPQYEQEVKRHMLFRYLPEDEVGAYTLREGSEDELEKIA